MPDSGTTLISFDKSLAPVIAGIVAATPAKKSGNRLTFPVTNVKGNSIDNRGAIKIGPTEARNLILVIGDGGNASITLDVVGLVRVETFTIKIVNKSKRQQVWRGFLHLPANSAIVEALNSSAGATVFTPDMALGQILATINIKT